MFKWLTITMVKYEHLKSLHGSSLVSSYGTPTLNGTWIVLRIVRYIYPLSRHERSCYQLITDYASCLFGSLPSKPWFMFVSTIKKLDLENWDCFQKSGQFYHPGESKICWCQLFQNSWLAQLSQLPLHREAKFWPKLMKNLQKNSLIGRGGR